MNSTKPQTGSAGLAVLCDRDGVIQQILSAGLGLSESLVDGRPLVDFVTPDSRGKALEFLRALRDEKIALDWELTVPLAGGELDALHFTGARLEEKFVIVATRSRAAMAALLEELSLTLDSDTELQPTLQTLAVQARTQVDTDAEFYNELTLLNNELASAQRELARKNAELARLNEQKNQFLGIAAHDLRNPLDVIMTYSMFVVSESQHVLSPEQLDFIEKIRTSSEFMLKLINDLLDVSRIESGRLDLELHEVDLLAVIKDNVARNQVLAAHKKIQIKLVSQEEIPKLRVDPSKIEQVLNNLLGNAIKFSPEGSLIEILVENLDEEVLVSVKDQGEGINNLEVDRLFRPFERGKASSSYKEKGTGLGLAICKRIIEGHGGRIWAKNLDSGGAIFSFSLPSINTG